MAVGAVGFLINATFLYLLYDLAAFPIIVAQIIAAELAILYNFFLHNKWTFSDSPHTFKKRLIMFHGSSAVGFLITTIVLVLSTRILGLHYLVALGLGGLIALSWNFIVANQFIWKRFSAAIAAGSE